MKSILFVYYHQSLPLYRIRLKQVLSGGSSLFFYYYIYPLYVKMYLNKHVYVIVQTEDIRQRFARRFNFPIHRIDSYFPELEIKTACNIIPHQFEDGTYNFVYPSIAASYKEHITLAYVLRHIYLENKDLASRIRIHLTIEATENKELLKYLYYHHLEGNFIFHGSVHHEQVMSMMKSCDGLVFPSVIETLGLPLLEAASLGIPIIANDLGYAREVLNGYEGVDFVAVHDYESWATFMMACCEKKSRYQYYHHPADDSWGRLIRKIQAIAGGHESTICVLATASAKRGALAIYNQFVNALANHIVDEEWHIFVDYDMPMPEISHVYYHRCHTKGFGRVWFDFVGFKSFVEKAEITPDVVFSLQNTGVRL